MISLNAYPVKANDMTWPIGVDTLRTDMARARSVSGNHLFAMIIYELRKMDATDAIRKVPTSTGQNSSLTNVVKRSIAPVKEIKAANLSTESVRYFPKR